MYYFLHLAARVNLGGTPLRYSKGRADQICRTRSLNKSKKGTFIHDERPLCRGFTDMTTTQQVGSSRTAAVRPARMAGSSSSNLYSRRESSPPTSNLRDQYACGHWWPCTVATTQPCTQRAIPPRLNGISDFTEIYWERSALANVARYRFYQRFAGVF